MEAKMDDARGSWCPPTAVDGTADAIHKRLGLLRLQAERAEKSAEVLWASLMPGPDDSGAQSLTELNVGGDTGFTLTQDHVALPAGSLLEALAGGRWNAVALRDPAGRIFLDIDPVQFRAILDWVFDVKHDGLGEGTFSAKPFPPSPAEWLPEPHSWGLDLLMGLFGLLGEDDLPKIIDRSGIKLDPNDDTAYTFQECMEKYGGEYSAHEVQEYWDLCMRSASKPSEQPALPSMPVQQLNAGVAVATAAVTAMGPRPPQAAAAGGEGGDGGIGDSADLGAAILGNMDSELAALVLEHVHAAVEEGQRLQDRLRKAERDERRFYRVQQGLQQLFGGNKPEDIVCFNAGGRVMASTKATLTCRENSMLARWFDGAWSLQPNEYISGAVQIEQDSESFSSVLQLLRFTRMFGSSGALPAGYPCRKAKLPVFRQVLSYFQLGSSGKGKGKGKAEPQQAGRQETPLTRDETVIPI